MYSRHKPARGLELTIEGKSLTNDILSLQLWKSQAFAREFKQREDDVKSDS